MDQLKEILRQAILYRFWISVGLSALLPMIAYFVGVGPVKTKAAAETAAINSADTEVKKYTSGDLPNLQYKPLVAERTDELSKDVDVSWRKLHKRQAPLLTWPKRVEDRFTKWGRKWPENTDSGAVQIAVIDYINAYPAFVTDVYHSFRPFDPEDGSGVVFAPPEDALLRPAKFELTALPDLGKVWAAQERLWIQRTLLDVVAQVNRSAKNWDGATIRQINILEVGTPSAQDQRSLAKSETLEEAPAITDPSKPADAPAETAAASPMAEMMGRSGRSMGMGGGGAAVAPETVSYIKTDSEQFKVLPVKMAVLIEQDRVAEYLVALANSPMTIEVMDFELAKPATRVVKPVKGEGMAGMGMGGMMGGMGGMMMGGMGRGGMTGFGGNYGQMMMGKSAGGMMGGMGGGMGGYSPGMGSGMGGMIGGGASTPARKGNDQRSKDLAKTRKEEEEKVRKGKTASLHDPYFNIVEVTIYGRARFFNTPPAAEAPDPSLSAAAPTPADQTKPADPAAAKAEGEAAKDQPETKAEPAKKAEDAKPDADKKADAETAKKAEETKPDADKKADAKPAPETKPEPPKPEAPKAETPKAKADAPTAPK